MRGPLRSRVRKNTRLQVLSSATLVGVLLATALVSLAGTGMASAGLNGNPAANLAPVPNFSTSGACAIQGGVSTCANPCIANVHKWPTSVNSTACTNYLLRAIDRARTSEGLGAMRLPTNWLSLNSSQQIFVVIDLEREARGLPAYLGLNSDLTTAALRAAKLGQDPKAAPGFVMGQDASGAAGIDGVWAAGYSALMADYLWMYDDGWGGKSATPNEDCTSARAAGCWSHRDEILGSDPGYNPGVGAHCTTCEVGAAGVSRGSGSFTALIELPAGAPPAMTFTWARNVVPYLRTRS